MHVAWKPGTMIYPLPAALVSCGSSPEEYNMLTVAWVGTICTNPAMCYISVRPERHSYPIIEKNRAFVINLTTEAMAKAVDLCGVKSGKDCDKWSLTGFTPIASEVVDAPYIKESPLCIECKVEQIIKLGSHDMFIAKVIQVLADDKYLNPENEKFELEKANLLAYSHGHYYGLGKEIGKFGWSVMKKKKKK
ncbi:MAG: flavin reductase family protein [Bacteroidales bacterium]|nr:flavin reductase family protein [Bacteroidales bacterium]